METDNVTESSIVNKIKKLNQLCIRLNNENKIKLDWIRLNKIKI